MKPRFTIATILLLTSLIACGISHGLTSRDLTRVRSELTSLRNDRAELNVSDSDRIYAIALPTYGHMQWRWRIQLPVKGTYRLRYSLSQIPISDLPATSTKFENAFLDNYNKPLAGGTPFILSLAVFMDGKGNWCVQTNVPDRGNTFPIKDPPSWLDNGSFLNWSTNVGGMGKTDSVANAEELVLIQYRKGKKVGGGITIDMQPTDGMMFWIERADEPD